MATKSIYDALKIRYHIHLQIWNYDMNLTESDMAVLQMMTHANPKTVKDFADCFINKPVYLTQLYDWSFDEDFSK